MAAATDTQSPRDLAAAAAPGPAPALTPAAAAPLAGAVPPDRRHRLANYATLGLLTLIWGTTWAAIRIGLRGMPPFTGVGLRFAIGAAVLAVVARAMGVRLLGTARPAPGARPSPWRVWLANGLLTFFIPYGVLYWAEQWVPSGLAAVLFATSPLWVALAAHLALPAERLRAATAAGVLAGFAGVAVIFSEDLRALGGPRVAGAAALLLVAPLTSAFGVVAVKRWSAGMHPLAIVTVPMGLAAAGMGCLALAAEAGQPPRLTGLPLAALLYLALFGSALSFTLYFWLLGRLPATTLSLINYLTPIVALLIGGAALGEPFTARTLAGSALVVGGVAVAMRARTVPAS
ncbi:MAG TPA: DMT family transporter [Thermoanaerobaculia bacterium]|nr:DMT family transporter [Thermoanaerobaculia bacterium]